jgi:tetratricopeptide (TPR) repeat protein
MSWLRHFREPDWALIGRVLVAVCILGGAWVSYRGVRVAIRERHLATRMDSAVTAFDSGDFAQAAHLAEMVLTTVESQPWTDDRARAGCLERIGLSRIQLATDARDTSMLDQAERNLRQSLAFVERADGPRSQRACDLVGDLARAAIVRNDLDPADMCSLEQAEDYALQSLELHRELGTVNSRRGASVYNFLGNAYIRTGRPAEAADAYERSVEIYQGLRDQSESVLRQYQDNYELAKRRLERDRGSGHRTGAP